MAIICVSVRVEMRFLQHRTVAFIYSNYQCEMQANTHHTHADQKDRTVHCAVVSSRRQAATIVWANMIRAHTPHSTYTNTRGEHMRPNTHCAINALVKYGLHNATSRRSAIKPANRAHIKLHVIYTQMCSVCARACIGRSAVKLAHDLGNETLYGNELSSAARWRRNCA